MDEVQNETVTISKADFDMQKLTADRLMDKTKKIDDVRLELHDIVYEFQNSIRDNEIESTTDEVFSIEDVNRLLKPLKAIGIHLELEVDREYSGTVTATVTFNVKGIRATSAEQAQELIEDAVRNANYESFFEDVDGYDGDTWLDDVTVDDVNPED